MTRLTSGPVAVDLTTDNHVHTSLCNHASGTMEEYVQAALDRGLTTLTFLEHLEAGITYFERTWLTDDDFASYFKEGERLRQKYRDRLNIRLGVEVGYNPEAVEELQAGIDRYPFDLVGISYHFFPQAGRHLNLVSRRPENIAAFTAMGTEQVLAAYFAGLREAVTLLGGDMLCHLDAALRHLPGLQFSAAQHEQIDELLLLLRDKGMRLEINTSGFALRGEPYPGREILSRAVALGIPLALSSDAHQPGQVGRYFERVADYLAGIAPSPLPSPPGGEGVNKPPTDPPGVSLRSLTSHRGEEEKMKASKSATQRARNLRINQTEAEKLLWRHLRNLPEYKFRRQLPLGPYIVDFACLSRKLIIELDGGQHAVTVNEDGKRSSFLAAQGFRVIRFWNSEVFAELEAVLEKITQSLG